MTAAPLVLAWAVLLGAGAWLHRPVPVRVARTRRAGRRLPPARARIVRAIVAAAIVAVVALPLAPIVGALVWVAPVLGQRRNERRRQDEVLRALPEVVDLVHLAVGAGLTVPLAVEAVAARASGPLADELRHAVGEVALGRRLADALGDVPA
ncbi:MAG TPA: hypothetical protein VEA78_01120, partial [Acidimicrobiales bacterium]|nr:hypothetical protein [Acidimicrobiales bacterium]